ncbi:MAG: EF-P lysine aminoacylase EpmA [Planctomycetota bacterium]
MTRLGRPDQAADRLPTATLTTLRHRARLLAAMRLFFDEAGYFEVETPILSSDIVVDAWLEPFVAEWLPLASDWSRPGSPRYLQTSPEFAMKRLLAVGATAIYQLGKVFRNGEVGLRHNPEFTMLEWYRVGDDHHALMRHTEALVRRVIDVASELLERGDENSPGATGERLRSPVLVEDTGGSKLPPVAPGVAPGDEALARHRDLARRVAHPAGFERLSYDDAFERHAGQRVLDADVTRLHDLAARHHLVPPPGLDQHDRDGWLNWLLAELVEPHLGHERPTFLFNYPASQAALARVSQPQPGAPFIAERFELYIDGVELCNGYHELTDPAVLRDRVREQLAVRAAAGLRPLPAESRLLAAMDAGLPASSGNALGVDRLVMLALGQTCLTDVIAFPFDRA